MNLSTLLLFLFTIIPLICTPGPDILLIASQGLANGQKAMLRAVTGVLIGYAAHAIFAIGLASLVAASPLLFSVLKWAGVTYLVYLAIQMIFSAIRPMNGVSLKPVKSASFWHGFLTSFLNPKGLLMYLAVLPQFISPEGSATIQALILLLVFIFGCTTVYTSLGILVASASKSGVSDKFRRSLEAVAGTLLATAAARIATQQ